MAVAFYVLRGSGKRKNRRFARQASPMRGLGCRHARAILNVHGDSRVAVTAARSQGETLKI